MKELQLKTYFLKNESVAHQVPHEKFIKSFATKKKIRFHQMIVDPQINDFSDTQQ